MADQVDAIVIVNRRIICPPCFSHLTYELKAAQSGQASSLPADSAAEKSGEPAQSGCETRVRPLPPVFFLIARPLNPCMPRAASGDLGQVSIK